MTPPQRGSGLRRALAGVGQWALVLVLTLVVGEAVARWAFGVQPLTTESLVWRYHPRWGWFHEPNSEDTFVKPGFAQHVRINGKGLRERPLPYEKPPGLFRVLVVGDSSVVSFEVPPEAVFTRVAEASLRERGYPVQFVNGGVRGYGTDQALLFLEEEGLRYEPDLVLYKWTNNDDEDNATIHRPFRKYGKAWFQLDEAGELRLRNVPVPDYPYHANLRVDERGEMVEHDVPPRTIATLWLRDNVLCRSAFGAGLLRLALSSPGMMQLAEAGSYQEEGEVPSELDRDSHLFRVTVAMVRRMIRSSREAGAELRMINTAGRDGFAKALLEATGLPDLGDNERWHALREPGVPVHMPHDPHWNELGHELYARALVESLLEDDVLPEPEAVAARGGAR